MIDFNCYVGNWPFHKVRKNTFEALKAVHKKNGISSGYVSSIESIFYNDFYESEKELHDSLKGSGYKHVVTVNPTLSGCVVTLKRCISEFDAKGIRLSPGYQGYTLDSGILDSVMDIAKENKLPVFVSMRMMDERLTHIMHPPIPTYEEIKTFVEKNPDTVIIFTHIKINESLKISDILTDNEKVFVDFSGYRSTVIGTDKYNNVFRKSVFGSAHPLIAVNSAVGLIQNEIEDAEIKDAVMNENVIKKYLNI